MKTKIFLVVLLALGLLQAFQANAQDQFPMVTVRFANPQFDCPTQTYCVDVEFLADVEGQQLFGMNVRFFYDDNVLEFLSMGDFAEGYDSPNPPQIITGPPSSGALFGLAGPVEWFNGTVQLVSPSSVYLSTSQWTKLFNICFHVDDPKALGIDNFCPSLIWDLQSNPDMGGFQPGDDGVVMTVVAPYPQETGPTMEQVQQFNWHYNILPADFSFGAPESVNCVSTKCGYVIPLSNWSLFLGIGLMMVVSVFIYRRRISG
jgi:hypothetical protein